MRVGLVNLDSGPAMLLLPPLLMMLLSWLWLLVSDERCSFESRLCASETVNGADMA